MSKKSYYHCEKEEEKQRKAKELEECQPSPPTELTSQDVMGQTEGITSTD